MKAYLSGKITGIEAEAKILFEEAEKRITALGYQVVNPMKLPHKHDKSWESYMDECLTVLEECEVMFMLPNWQESEGAMIEHAKAEYIGVDIYYLN
jgi:hypothetical protein